MPKKHKSNGGMKHKRGLVKTTREKENSRIVLRGASVRKERGKKYGKVTPKTHKKHMQEKEDGPDAKTKMGAYAGKDAWVLTGSSKKL